MQCHVWRSSKTSSISNSKPSRWMVGTLIFREHSLKMTDKLKQLHVMFACAPSLTETVIPLCGNCCSCDWWGGEAAEDFSSSHQQSEWIQKSTACPRLRPSSLDSIYKFAFTSSERPDRYKEEPGQDWRADQPAGEEGAGGVAEEAAESLHWRTS